MKDTDFASITGLIRVLEKRMLSNEALGRIIDAGTPDEALRALSQNSGYDFSQLKKPEDYDAVLKESLEGLYAWLYKSCENEPIPDLLSARYVFHNLKTALKSKFLNKDHRHLYIRASAVNPDILHDFVFKGEHADIIPPHIAKAAGEAADAFNMMKDPQAIDIIADAEMFSYMLGLCKALGNDFITAYVRYTVMFGNVKTLLRVKNMKKDLRFLRECLVEGGPGSVKSITELFDNEPQDILSHTVGKNPECKLLTEECLRALSVPQSGSSLERLFDNFLLEYLKKTKYIAFGPEILFSYVLFKENEIRQIRILMTCKINGIREQALRERLRDNYA